MEGGVVVFVLLIKYHNNQVQVTGAKKKSSDGEAWRGGAIALLGIKSSVGGGNKREEGEGSSDRWA